MRDTGKIICFATVLLCCCAIFACMPVCLSVCLSVCLYMYYLHRNHSFTAVRRNTAIWTRACDAPDAPDAPAKSLL